MKTTLPDSITTIDEAKKFLTDLHKNGESYNPEDNAKDCLEDITERLYPNMRSKFRMKL